MHSRGVAIASYAVLFLISLSLVSATPVSFLSSINANKTGDAILKQAMASGSPPPSGNIMPTAGPIGTVVSLQANGFGSASTIQIQYDGNSILTNPSVITANSSGGFQASVTIPKSTVGIHWINASDSTGSLMLGFNVNAPILVLTPAGSNGSNTIVKVNGSGFMQNSQLTISFDGKTIATNPSNVVTDSAGEFSALIISPASPAGNYTIDAADTAGNSASSSFTIKPAISLNPSAAGNLTSVSVVGSGFAASSQITLSYSGSPTQTNPVTPLTDSSGQFSAFFRVPPGPSGLAVVQARDSASNLASATFNRTDTSTLTVITQDMSGNNTQGYFTVLEKDGSVLSQGFSPMSFTLKNGKPYQIAVSSYGTAVFDHWLDTNTSDDPRTITIFNNTQIVAVYGTTGISVSPSMGRSSAIISIAGNSFSPNSGISLRFDGNAVISNPSILVSDSNGKFLAQFSVPAQASIGKHYVVATDGSNAYATTFVVSNTPAIGVFPQAQSAGNPVTITGSVFASNSVVTLKLDGNTLSSINTNDSGSFKTNFIISPQVPIGTHNLSATDSLLNSASAQLNVTNTSVLTISAQDIFGNVIPGMFSVVTFENESIVSSGFSPNNYTLINHVHYSVGMGNYGAYVFDHWQDTGSSVNPRIVALTSNSQVTAVYAITAITSSPSIGPAGTMVKISGNSFSPNSSVNIAFDAVKVANATSDSLGSFGGVNPPQFVIPSDASTGLHRIQATDGNGISYSVPYYVGSSPSMSITPAAGVVGSEILVRGFNYAPYSRITLGYDAAVITNDPGTSPTTITTDSKGSFSAMFEIPSSPAGVHLLNVSDSWNNRFTTQFTVSQNVLIFPTSGHAGTVLTVPGSGFAPNSFMHAYYDGISIPTVPTGVKTNANGQYSGMQVRIPINATLGTHTVTIQDGVSHPHVFSAIFTVTDPTVPIYTLQHEVIALPTFAGLTEMSFIPDNGPNKAGSGAFMVAIKNGGVAVAKYVNGAFKVQPVHFVDVSTAKGPEDEGLLGLVVDPNWINTKQVYLYRSVNVSGIVHNEVIRYTGTTDSSGNIVAIPASLQVVLTGIPGTTTATSSSHNGGHLKFDSQGNLYISTGDNFLYTPAQDLTTLNGKLLKVTPLAAPDPSGRLYTIPLSNPFANSSDPSIRKEIFSYGLRNPFSFDIDPVTGQLFLSNVGNNSWEMFDNATAPSNFGWPDYEGPTPGNPSNFTNYNPGIYWYPHQGTEPISGPVAGLEATTGATFYHPYNGTGYPSELDGAYLFGDFAVGFVKALLPASKFAPITDPLSGQKQWQTETIMTGLNMAPIDMEVWHGTVFMTDLFGNVHAIRYSPTLISLKPTTGPAGTLVVVNGLSYPPTSNVTLTINGARVTTAPATVTSTPYGTFTANVTIPASTPPGTATVAATVGSVTSSASFTVIAPPPKLTLNSIPGGPWNSTITVSGALLAGGSNTPIQGASVSLSGNGTSGFLQSSTATTKSDGTFSITGLSPASVSSNWIVSAQYAGNATLGGSTTSIKYSTTKHVLTWSTAVPNTVPWGQAITLTTKILDFSKSNTPVSGLTIHWNGTGTAGASDQNTNQLGTASVTIIASSSVATGFTVQSHITGSGTALYQPLDSIIKSYSTVRHTLSFTTIVPTSVKEGQPTHFTSILRDTSAGNVPVSALLIHWNGTGVVGVNDITTDATGTAIGIGTAPASVASGWTVQSQFAGNGLYAPAKSVIKTYSTTA